MNNLMKFSRLVLLNMLAVWSGLVLSCSRHSTIDDRLTEAEALISIAPDSAQEILEDIRFHEATNINERQKAYLCILIAKAKNSQGKPSSQMSLLIHRLVILSPFQILSD